MTGRAVPAPRLTFDQVCALRNVFLCHRRAEDVGTAEDVDYLIARGFLRAVGGACRPGPSMLVWITPAGRAAVGGR